MSTPTPVPFESALESLQQIVRQLESGELTLEQSLQAFESGVKLTRACQDQLSAAEQRVELLMKVPSGAQPATASDLEMQPMGRVSAPKSGSRANDD